jgi:hypothetical protein
VNQPSQAAIAAGMSVLSKTITGNLQNFQKATIGNDDLLAAIAAIERNALERAARIAERAHKEIPCIDPQYEKGMKDVCTEAAAAIRAMKP